MFDVINAANVVLVICCMNLVPIAYELILGVFEKFGYEPDNVPHLTQITRAINLCGFAGEWGLVGTVLGLIFTAIYLHVFHFFPFFNHDAWLPVICVHILPSIYLNIGMLVNLFITIRSDAGSTIKEGKYEIPETIREQIQASLSPGTCVEDLSQRRLKEALRDVGIRYCEMCRRPKPEGAHHCSTCGTCTRRMDHHCPFAANCVGEDNYRYFFLFVMNSVGATYFAMFLTFPSFVDCYWSEGAPTDMMVDASGHEHAHDPNAGLHSSDPTMDLLCETLGKGNRLLFLLALFCAIVLTVLFGCMVYLLRTGQTMMEVFNFSHKDPRSQQGIRNPKLRAFYAEDPKVGAASASKNVRAVFGPPATWWRWFSPVCHGIGLLFLTEVPDLPSFDQEHGS